MVVEWDASSWADSDAVLAAVEIENRLQGNCGENDTIALAFTSAITNTVDAYLEGEVAVNDAVAPIPLKDVDNASLSEALKSSSKYDRIFVRLAGDVCMRDTSTATTPQSSLGDTEILVLSLFTGDACAGFSSSSGSTLMPPQVPAEMGDTRDWQQDLTYIVPVGVFVFLLGCVGLVYTLRRQKNSPAKPSTPPLDDVKSIITSFRAHDSCSRLAQ
ncbi:Protocadherin alpha 4 unspliced [Phytophthora cinnamomi]|uniref:Protocadherin alpha 4 unspliced n=1 Tax=Phytophthora cinnamomi TaxID=4785 RepID=UPI00355A4344|nr:Protocadherin alpha 4 unspliced [Phytophthora cinnamomi]